MLLTTLLLTLWTLTSATSSIESPPPEVKGEYDLLSDLFRKYNRLEWPFPGENRPYLDVEYTFSSLVEFDEKKQILSTSGMFMVVWFDGKLTWYPKEYNNTKVIYVDPSTLWKPDALVLNAVSNFGSLGTDNMKVYIDYTGLVIWFPGDYFKTFCKVDITHYPMDVQRCQLNLIVWGCPEKSPKLKLHEKGISNKSHTINGEWEIVNIEAKEGEGDDRGAYFTLVLKRKRLFYIVNMILPIMFLSLLNFLVFALPVESGEKMTLCISILLSYAVFLTLVNAQLPENSEGLCYFSAYLAAEILISAASTFTTVLVLRFYHRKGKLVVSKRYAWLLNCLVSKTIPEHADEKMWTMEQNQEKDEDQSSEEAPVSFRWSDVAAAVDSNCLKMFLFINILVTISFLLGVTGILF